jgi:hypothetical protein
MKIKCVLDPAEAKPVGESNDAAGRLSQRPSRSTLWERFGQSATRSCHLAAASYRTSLTVRKAPASGDVTGATEAPSTAFTGEIEPATFLLSARVVIHG